MGVSPTNSGFRSVSTLFLILLQFYLLSVYTATGIRSNRGELVRFNCSVDSGSSVDWQFAKTKDSSKINIFIGNARRGGGQKSGGYVHRTNYDIQIDIQSGRYDLIIDSVTKRDEGFYFCTDVSNPGSTTTTKLTVLGDEEEEEEEEVDSCSNDISAVVGDTVTLTFPTAKKDSIILEHRSVDRNYPLHVFRDGRLVNSYYALSGRFSFSASNGSWILIIKNVQSLDAGSFTCSEDNGLGKQYFRELIVDHASEVVCSADADSCHQELNVTCTAKYSGSFPPRIQFILDGNIQPRNESRVTTGNTVSLRAVVDWGNVPLCRFAVQKHSVNRICTPPENSCEEANSGLASKTIAIFICTVISMLIIIVTVIIVLSNRKRLRRRSDKRQVLKRLPWRRYKAKAKVKGPLTTLACQ